MENLSHIFFLTIFLGLILFPIKSGLSFSSAMLQITYNFIFCIIMTLLIRHDEQSSRNLMIVQMLFLTPLLLYVFISILSSLLENPTMNVDFYLNIFIVDLFHGVKDYGISIGHSLLVVFCIPLSTMIVEKIYLFFIKHWKFIKGDQKPINKNIVDIKQQNFSINNEKIFWKIFSEGFNTLFTNLNEVRRYTEIVYIFSFMSIFLLRYFFITPLVSQYIPEAGQAYWVFIKPGRYFKAGNRQKEKKNYD